MLKNGQVLAAGPVDDVLTPARIRELYDVEAEVTRHPRTGHLTVTPLAAGDRAMTDRRPPARAHDAGLRRRGRRRDPPRAAGRIHAYQPGAGVRPVDPLRGQRRRADLLRRAAAADARRRAGRIDAGERRRGVPGTAAQSARDPVHARRVGRRRARRDARDHVRLVARLARRSGWRRSPASSARWWRSASSTRSRPRGTAACPRTSCCWPA